MDFARETNMESKDGGGGRGEESQSGGGAENIQQ